MLGVVDLGGWGCDRELMLPIHHSISHSDRVSVCDEDIKQNAALKLFRWDMKSPSLRPDGRAEFIVEGEPSVAKVD